MAVTIMTFGYKFGPPGEGFAYVADVRNIPMMGSTAGPNNNGNDPKLHAEIMGKTAAKNWLAKMEKWSVSNGDKIAIGCSRGHHRSVALASEYAKFLRSKGFTVSIQNRDIGKKYSLSIGELLMMQRSEQDY